MSRFQDLTDFFKRLLRTAAREDLIGHFETTISGYEKEISRQQKLLDVVLKPGIKLRRAVCPADVQQLLVSTEEVPPEQQRWSPLLIKEEPEPPHIKEEQEGLWRSQDGEQLHRLDEADVTKVSRFQDLKDLFKQQLLSAAREDLIGRFETTISRYEKEIDRQQKLLDVVLKPEIKLRRADVQQLMSREEVPPEQQRWSPLLIKEEPEPPHIKEEQEELWRSQDGEQLQQLEEADVTKFTFTPVPVKSEDDDDEEKPQTSQLHQTQTEEMRREAAGEDCGGPEPARNSDPERHLQPDDKSGNSSETETDDRDKDWEDTERKTFSCSVCGKNLKHKSNLKIHMRTHTGVKPFSCSLCGKRFTQRAGLDYHLKVHTGERPFSCSVCGKTYRHKGALTYHMVTHTGVKPFTCSCCGKRFRGRKQLKIHKCVSDSSQVPRGLSDKRKKPLSCSECDATFPNQYLLTTHIRMHKGKKLFTCSVCGKKLQFSSHLEIHMRSHTGEKPYSCSVCGKRFSQKGIMKQHMAVHSEVKPFSCSYCGRRFFWHFQIKKHKCPGAPSWQRLGGFNGKDSGGSDSVRSFPLYRHLKPDSNKDKELPFETDASDDIDFWKETRQHQSGFTYRRNKKTSVRVECDTTKKLSPCPDGMAKTDSKTEHSINLDFCKQSRQCLLGVSHLKSAQTFVNDSGFNSDNESVSFSVHHKGSENTLQIHNKCPTVKKQFKCLFCGKGFATGGYLTRHVSLHIGEKLLSCTVCEETFTLESELISHKCGSESSQPHHSQSSQSLHFHMSCHTGDKPFHCSVCSSGFTDSESLVKHMRIHTRQTQFSCSVCGKEFAWRRFLTKHMEVHAKEKIFRCRVCDGGFTQINQLRNHQCFDESSQLCESQAEENSEAELLTSSSNEQMEMEADGEDTRGPDPVRNLDPERHLQPDTDDSADSDFWQENREPQPGFDSQEHSKVSQSDTTVNAGRKQLNCSESDETFSNNHCLKIHKRNYTQEKQLNFSTCKNSYEKSMEVHAGLRRGAERNPEPPHIKEEQEELWSSQDGEQLHQLEEADISKFTFTPVPVKREDEDDDDDDEEKPQTSQLHQRRTEQIEMDADEEDCGGPEPTRNSDPERHFQPDSDDSVDSDFLKETRQHQSGFTYRRNKKTSVRVECDTTKKLSPCPDGMAKTDSKTEHSINLDFCKQSRQCLLGVSHLKSAQTFVNDSGFNSDNKSVSFSVHHKGSENTLQIHNKCPTVKKQFKCLFCGKGFATGGYLTRHVSLHIGEKLLSCTVCEETFTLESELISHKCGSESSQPHHSQTVEQFSASKSFSCPQCSEGFCHKHLLRVHIKIHSEENPFSCSVCGKTFGRKESLHFHMSCHTGDKPFHCSVCSSGFTDSESLVKHMRIHTRQTLFSCSVCGKEFAWRRYLTKHMEVHAKEKIFRCRVCDGGFSQIHQLRNHECCDESSQLCESQAEENSEAELLTSSSNEQMEMEADGEDTRGPDPVRNLDPERHLQPDTDDSADSDFWQENREPQPGFDSQEHSKVSQSDTTVNAGRKQLNCSESDETFSNNHCLKIHKRNYTQEKQLNFSTCKNSYEKSMEVHAGLRRGAERNPEPPHIKEEQEELWSSQDGEQLHQLEEADISKFTFTPVPVKRENDDDDGDGDGDEEKPQTSQLHQRQTEQIKTDADGEDCGGPEPARNSDPERHFQPNSDDSVDSDFWKETRERSTCLSSLKNDEIPEGFVGLDSGNKVFGCSEDKAPESLEPVGDDSHDSDFWKDNSKPQQTYRSLYNCRKPYSCSECNKRFFHIHHLKSHKKFHLRERTPFFCSVCGQGFLYKSHLKIHMRTHTGEKPFPCPVCGKKYAHKASMQSHMVVHTVNKQYACNACHRSFAWYTELKYHRCVGESSHETPYGGKNM